MSNDYGAIAASILAAILVAGLVEIANTLRTLGTEEHKLDLMFAEELKESAIALRSGIALPPEIRLIVNSRVRIYKKLRSAVRRKLAMIYFLWGLIITTTTGLLVSILSWAADANSGTAPRRATLIFHGTYSVLMLTFFTFLLRVTFLRALRVWERRVELAGRMGLNPAEMRSLMKSWARANGIKR
ncbi:MULTISPECIES: hypothetical protein [Streptomyces]|nr:hypothetical protein [Streptomyces canarius]